MHLTLAHGASIAAVPFDGNRTMITWQDEMKGTSRSGLCATADMIAWHEAQLRALRIEMGNSGVPGAAYAADPIQR